MNYSIIDNKIYYFNDFIKVIDIYIIIDFLFFDVVLVFSSEFVIYFFVLEFIEIIFKYFKLIVYVFSNFYVLDNSKIKLDGVGVYNLINILIELFIEGIV